MRKLPIGLCLFLLVSASFGRGEATGFISPEKLSWHYTLAVQKGAQNYSFSLMKDRWLAFDIWQDGEDVVEKRIPISMKQFSDLKGKFSNTFEKIRHKKDFFTGSQPSYMFEEVTDTVSTLEFKGLHSEISQLLRELSYISKIQLPFETLE